MTIKQFISITPRIVNYNMKIIFAGKFFWFILAAFSILAFFMFQNAWNRKEINEGVMYSMLIFPSLLLVFYPAVFGIQNDEDCRILEILFGIPNYRYKIWGMRLLIIYIAIYFILVLFSFAAKYLLFPIDPFETALQLMFPVLFFGNMAFMFSTITRSGNGTAVVIIMLGIALLFFGEILSNSFWNVMLNPFESPDNIHPYIWESTLIKNRIFLFVGATVWLMIGLLNLQKREKFV